VVGQKTTAQLTSAGSSNATQIQLKQTATTTNNLLLNNNSVNSNNNNTNNNSNLSVNISNNSNNKINSQYIANSSSHATTNATATQIVINSNKSNNKLLNSNSNSLPTVNSKSIAITASSVPPTLSLVPTTTVHNNKTIHDKKSQNLSAGVSLKQMRERQDKKFGAAFNANAAMGSGTGAAVANAYYPTIYGDDDINDVAAMGGVNLAEESQRILGSTEFVGTQIRSCKDEVFLNLPILQQKIRASMAKHGLDEPSGETSVLLSHATQEHLKNIVEKLAVIAEHRMDILKVM
jgi:transcription initiation factor TFIID subunit 4